MIRMMRGTILGGISLCVLVGILFVGLWPFTAHPQNQVAWLENSNGLRFGDYADIVSSAGFSRSGSEQGGPCSLEMWLEPGVTDDTNTMLAFYTPENLFQFRIRQFNESLFLTRGANDQDHVRTVQIGVEHVLRHGRKLFLTITSDGKSTSIYENGELAQRSSHFGLTSKDFTGQLIVGNAPLENDSWSGELRGLAIYARDLNPEEILQHYQFWVSGEHPERSASKELIGLYTFDERSGRIIHNRANSGPDLFIPNSYEIGRYIILEPFWKEYHPGLGYYKNVAINIAGFIPLGFVFTAYLARIKEIRRAVLVSIVLGFTTSLTIEILQAYIPTRASGMTDVITNTLGTAIGARLYGYKLIVTIFDKLGL